MRSVFFGQFEVGRIAQKGQDFFFRYDQRWLGTKDAFPVSVSMPLVPEEYGPETLIPWLANLLPEEKNLITIGRNLGISPQDIFGLLDRIGHDVAGALVVGEPRNISGWDYRVIDDDDVLQTIIDELPKKPFLAGEDRVSMSLAGVQDKLPVAMVDGKLAIPLNGAPSTHILKPDSKRLAGSVQNEALCLVLARRCGLNAAELTTGVARERNYLLVTRFDRARRDGRIIRLHQEDFCQALCKLPMAKYERNQSAVKGPGLRDFFDLASTEMTAADVNALLNAIIFNILICNTDSHAKNYSILLSSKGARLAPLYDLMCAKAWEGITLNHPQEIAGKNRGTHIHGRHWRRFAQSCGLNETMVIERIAELAGKLRSEITAAVTEVVAMPAGAHYMLAHFQTAIEDCCKAVENNLVD